MVLNHLALAASQVVGDYTIEERAYFHFLAYQEVDVDDRCWGHETPERRAQVFQLENVRMITTYPRFHSENVKTNRAANSRF